MKKTENTVEVVVVKPFCIGYEQIRYEPRQTYKFEQSVAQNIVSKGLGKLKAETEEKVLTSDK